MPPRKTMRTSSFESDSSREDSITGPDFCNLSAIKKLKPVNRLFGIAAHVLDTEENCRRRLTLHPAFEACKWIRSGTNSASLAVNVGAVSSFSDDSTIFMTPISKILCSISESCIVSEELPVNNSQFLYSYYGNFAKPLNSAENIGKHFDDAENMAPVAANMRACGLKSPSLAELGSVLLSRPALEKFQQAAVSLRRSLSSKPPPVVDKIIRQWCLLHFSEQAKQVVHTFAYAVVHDDCSVFVKVKTAKLLLTRCVEMMQLAGVSFPTFPICPKPDAPSDSNKPCDDDERLVSRIRQIDQVFSHSTYFAPEIAEIIRKLFAQKRENDVAFTRTLDLQFYGLYHLTYALMLLRRYRTTDITASSAGHAVSTFLTNIDRYLPASVKDIDLGMWMDAFMTLHKSLYELGILHATTATALARFQADLIGYHILSRAEEELLIMPNFVRYLDLFIADEVVAFTTYVYHNAVIMSLVEAVQAKQKASSHEKIPKGELDSDTNNEADSDEIFVLHAVQILGYYVSDCLDVMLQKGHDMYSRILLESLYDMILLWPTSRPAMLDLGQTMRLLPADEQHQHMLKLKRDLSSRLLHPGTPTRQILTVYVKLLQAFRIVDRSCTLLRLVHEPVRDYIRQRRDTVSVIMKSFARLSSNIDAVKADEENLSSNAAGGGSELDALIALDNAPPVDDSNNAAADESTSSSPQPSVSMVNAWTGGLDVRSALRRRAEASERRSNEPRSHFSASAASSSQQSSSQPPRRVRFVTTTPSPTNDADVVAATPHNDGDAEGQSEHFQQQSNESAGVSASSTANRNNDAGSNLLLNLVNREDLPLEAREAVLGLSMAAVMLDHPPTLFEERRQQPSKKSQLKFSPLAASSPSTSSQLNGSPSSAAAVSPLTAAMQPIRIALDDWRTWQPEPVFAEDLNSDYPFRYSLVQPKSSSKGDTTSARQNLLSSTLDILIGIYGGQEVFVKEYQVLLAEKLLGYYAPLNIAVEQNILHKLFARFGQRMMLNCEVMLRDGVWSHLWCGNSSTTLPADATDNSKSNFARRPLFDSRREYPSIDYLQHHGTCMRDVMNSTFEMSERPVFDRAYVDDFQKKDAEARRARAVAAGHESPDRDSASPTSSEAVDIEQLPYMRKLQLDLKRSRLPLPQWSVLLYSNEYWPEMPVEPLRLPEPFNEIQEAIRKDYEQMPTRQRTLNLRPDLGYVTLKFRIKPTTTATQNEESSQSSTETNDEEFVRVSCPAYYAAVLLAFRQRERWSLADLAQHLETTPSVLKRKIRYWIQRGVLNGPTLTDDADDKSSTALNSGPKSEESQTYYALNEQLNRQLLTSALEAGRSSGDYLGTSNAADDENEMSAASDGGGGGDSQSTMRQHHYNRQGEEFANQVQFFWRYIQSMLISVKTLSLDRMFAMLKMFINRSQTTREVTKDQLRGFLEGKIERGELILNSVGSYSLPAKQ